MQAMTESDVPVALENDSVELRMSEVGDMTVSFIRLAAGTDPGTALVGLPADRCPCPHWGYMLEGTLLMRTAEGDKTSRQGEAFYWAPGHAPVAPEDCANVGFSPTRAFHTVIDHIKGA